MQVLLASKSTGREGRKKGLDTLHAVYLLLLLEIERKREKLLSLCSACLASWVRQFCARVIDFCPPRRLCLRRSFAPRSALTTNPSFEFLQPEWLNYKKKTKKIKNYFSPIHTQRGLWWASPKKRKSPATILGLVVRQSHTKTKIQGHHHHLYHIHQIIISSSKYDFW